MELDQRVRRTQKLIIDRKIELKEIDNQAVVNFEEDRSVKLGPTISTYFRKISGLNGISIGHIFFYGINNIEPASGYIESCVKKDEIENFYVIADFDDWCWGYVVDITDDADLPVYRIIEGRGCLLEISKSINEFIEMALDDSLGLIEPT